MIRLKECVYIGWGNPGHLNVFILDGLPLTDMNYFYSVCFTNPLIRYPNSYIQITIKYQI